MAAQEPLKYVLIVGELNPAILALSKRIPGMAVLGRDCYNLAAVPLMDEEGVVILSSNSQSVDAILESLEAGLPAPPQLALPDTRYHRERAHKGFVQGIREDYRKRGRIKY